MNYDFRKFIDAHKSQLVSSDIPEYFWYSLSEKLKEETYDIGDICELKLNSDETEVECVIERSLMSADGENIFIIDNAWTFTLENAKFQLKEMNILRERIAAMIGIDTEDTEEDLIISNVIDNLWSHLRYYDIKDEVSKEICKIFYVLDEAGTYIKHESDKPSVRIVPFIYAPNDICYSIAWLIRDVEVGEKLTVNRIEHITDRYLHECISYVWTKRLPQVPENSTTLTPEFFNSHRVEETDPMLDISNLGKLDKAKAQFNVYTDVSFVQNSFKQSNTFKLVDEKSDADIIWLFDHFKDYKRLSEEQPQSLVNQFPSETVMTTKDLLAALGKDSKWIPQTFNLKTELAEFIQHFSSEEYSRVYSEEEVLKDCPCNCHDLNINCDVCVEDKSCRIVKNNIGPVWIIKPWNMSRGLGIFITQNINHILRMVEAFPQEPKIASRYISDPVLFYRSDIEANVKFDIRYMVLLSSIEPLRVFASKIFWIRFANKQFVLCKWDDYETHFTVMNYKENCKLMNINYEEFIKLFKTQYSKYEWRNVEREIHRTLKVMMEDVTRRPDPLRIKHNPQSRGMYAVDLMLEWNRDSVDDSGLTTMSPQICEVNFCPDCTRAVQYNPDFFEDIFKTLFLDQPTNVVEL